MAYSDFSISEIEKSFGLTEKQLDLFPNRKSIEPSSWLRETLQISLKLALASSSEKARSEFIIAPILLEIKKRNEKEFSIFSGERLDVDEKRGLKGECDFILSKGPISTSIQAPIFALVEAKKNDIKAGLGQCIAQMVGANIFNQNEDSDIKTIYGCVTTGESWQFLKLAGNIVSVDVERYYINQLEQILWILQSVIDGYK